MVSYYDLVLGLIPLVLLGGSGTLHFGGVTSSLAVAGGGLLAIALVAHALFVRSPVHAAPSAAGGSVEA